MLPGGGPLQFLRDTLMGPSDAASQHHAAAAVAAAAGTGASPKHRPPATPTTVSRVTNCYWCCNTGVSIIVAFPAQN